MRTIKFRGYVPTYLGMKGYWAYGLLARYNDELATIVSNDKLYTVLSNTIGQFTGLHDKNGVEIYEGDIVEFEYNNAKMIKEVYWDNEWNCWKVYINGGNIHTLNSHSMGYLIPTVIGNIHEGGEK